MTLTAKQLTQSVKHRERLIQICLDLPKVSREFVGEGHIAFRIRKKIFAYYLFDHHGDGKIALCCKSTPGEQRQLIRDDPEIFFMPAYLGAKGWIGFRLDLDDLDWETVTELVRRAYQLSAPRRLAAALD